MADMQPSRMPVSGVELNSLDPSAVNLKTALKSFEVQAVLLGRALRISRALQSYRRHA